MPLLRGVLQADRRSLAKAITLVESQRAEDHHAADALLEGILPHTGKAMRIGLSGPPGVGKSTLIEALGLKLVSDGKKVAILAIDPTSQLTGGSILGDKTRMQRLSVHPKAFVRPSPAGTALGGIARHSYEALLICEAAGFDVILVETVGVGQSEAQVASLVDTTILLMQPGSGDELQAIKRGILEVADIVVVNKADDEQLAAAELAKRELVHALALRKKQGAKEWAVPIILASAKNGTGIDMIWDEAKKHHETLVASDVLERKRSRQREQWFWQELKAETETVLRQSKTVINLATGAASGKQSVRQAVQSIAAKLLK